MKAINVELFIKMLNKAVEFLHDVENEMNETNVYPVADRDTGSNMLYTLRIAVENARTAEKDVSCYLKALNDIMFLNCRGNSGNILAQIFKGFEEGANGKSEIDAFCFLDMIKQADQNARSVVDIPKEGTILTVLSALSHRLSLIEKIEDCSIEELIEIAFLFSYYAFLETRFQLYENRTFGVEDSGARGMVEIFRAMFETVSSEKNSYEEKPNPETLSKKLNADDDCFCLEFVIKLFSPGSFAYADFKRELGNLGSSVVVLKNENNIKIHIHTNNVNPVVSYCSCFGKIENLKSENMMEQMAQKEDPEYYNLLNTIRESIGRNWNPPLGEPREITFCKIMKCIPFLDDSEYCKLIMAEDNFQSRSLSDHLSYNDEKIVIDWTSFLKTVQNTDWEELVFLFLPDSQNWKKSEDVLLKGFSCVFPDNELKIYYNQNTQQPTIVFCEDEI